MLDFLEINMAVSKTGIEIVPEFIVKKTKDLMIRGGDFYAIWDEANESWSTDPYRAVELIDAEIRKVYDEKKETTDEHLKPLYLSKSSTKQIDKWNHYCKDQLGDNYVPLDSTLVFSNSKPGRKLYSSHRLSYPLEDCPIPSYDFLMSTLYAPEERMKLEWAIGAIVSGESKRIQKFVVLYGSAGSGKSTFLNIVQMLFDGYYSVFDARGLGQSSNAFALESFKSNPLVAIQHDGDLSKIEDNTRLNSIVSHEEMIVNEKFKQTYAMHFDSFLFMGTNKPVKITDAKSGIIRRLIDVEPSGNKVSYNRYVAIMEQIPFELGGIATHCLKIYNENKNFYDDYIPLNMIGASNDFFNFVEEYFDRFDKADSTTLRIAYDWYKDYAKDSNILYPLGKTAFKEELKNYFEDFYERERLSDGSTIRSSYRGFLREKFIQKEPVKKEELYSWIDLKEQESVFDRECANLYAQYASEAETPSFSWNRVSTKLSDLDTSKLHYVMLPESHIVIDFDLKDENGNKSLEKNLEAASKFPPTYTETSKSGQGLHLHYIYTGDVKELSSLYDTGIEVKVFTGKSSLRRKLSKCNDLSIRDINSGLPRKEKPVVTYEGITSEIQLNNYIRKALRKEVFPNTKPSVDYIKKVLDDAYASGITYSIDAPLREAIVIFALSSTHNAKYCVDLVDQMHFESKDIEEQTANAAVPTDDRPILFFDVEVYPNLFVWAQESEDNDDGFYLINPSAEEIRKVLEEKLVGFNNRRYDNHIIYGKIQDYANIELFELSQNMINNGKGFFKNAYNLSYTDVYDFAASYNKKSLKKFEIELGIDHIEMGLPWDQPVDPSLWNTVGEYCLNDVKATKAVFKHLKSDWVARQILSEVADLTPNDTTNTITTKIIFQGDKSPQREFMYRDLALPVKDLPNEVLEWYDRNSVIPMPFDENSLLPYFDGYTYTNGVSTYKGIKVGEGGYVEGEPGIYYDVALLDVASMHPHSIITECLFGPRYTSRFKEIVDTRVLIKHEDYEKAMDALEGALKPFLDGSRSEYTFTSKELANALKTAINSVYGLTAASFENAFRDKRNIDNIVAKRGALFMVDLSEKVKELGFTVAHIKTDSIKIPNATSEIINLVMEFGKKYGYTFEHEATYDRMCLVNHAVYIAYYDGHWEATGAQFAHPYVFKTLFSKDPITFQDLCEAKSASTALYLDMNEGLPEGEHNYIFIGKVSSFYPVKPGMGGGELVAQRTDKNGDVKYDSVAGAKGYRWKESAGHVLTDTSDVDISYFRKLVDDAYEQIAKYGDPEVFLNINRKD